MKRILVTGGAGFIGSHFVRHLLRSYDYEVVNYDALKYAGNLANVADLADDPRYEFVEGDIADRVKVRDAVTGCDAIVNFAAETHVDRSLMEPGEFITTDVYGTYVLLEAARTAGVERYVQVSTDEVYGSVATGSSRESDPIDPRSPYAASKAGGDLMVRAYVASFGLNAMITRGSNTYGPYQYPEKLIPLFITNAIDDLPLPLYGDGLNVRDWLHVEDHCRGIATVLHRGERGEVYNVGGGNEHTNHDLTYAILGLLGKPASLIQPVADRPGHDRRYSLDSRKLRRLGWAPVKAFDAGLRETVEWYASNERWWRPLKSGGYEEYYRRNYAHRLER